MAWVNTNDFNGPNAENINIMVHLELIQDQQLYSLNVSNE